MSQNTVDKEVEEIADNIKPCIGCGHCCIKSPCSYELMKHGDRDEICPELIWSVEDNRYICKAILNNPKVARALYAGEGCCANMNSWRWDVKERFKNRFEKYE